METFYVHDLSPIIFKVGDFFALRWYGFAYVLGFILGYLLLKSLSKRGLWCLPADKVGDFVTYAAVFGVMLGGRLGYILFYYLRSSSKTGFWDDPLVIFRVWEGGMSSHGGLIGLILFSLFYSWKHKVSWVGLLDGLSIAAPIGIFFGRVANFINGELYGRVAQGVSWAMKFPMEMWDNPSIAYKTLVHLHEKGSSLVPEYPINIDSSSINRLIGANRVSPEVTEALSLYLPARHPSQLYEAFAEGLLLFVVLYGIRLFCRKAPEGVFSGLFCILYGAGRIVVECYREPDAPLVGAMTTGQFLSLFLFAIGAVLLCYAWKKRSQTSIKEKK